MRITFLGTSAANAFPEPFCSCANCISARAEGGESLRKRSSALINDDLLIDLGPDIMSASQQHGIDLTRVRFCIQTHPHADHLDLSHLLSRSPGFGVVGAPRLHFYASSETLAKARQTFRRDLSNLDLFSSKAQEELNLQIHTIKPHEPFEIGRYRIIGYPANHAPGSGALIFSITSTEGTILYAADTAELWEETWQSFQVQQMNFDLIVFDHTYGPEEPGSDHLSARQIVEHIQRMKAEGLLSDQARVLATHIAHEGNPAHSELSRFAADHSYRIAYDGLAISM